MRHNALSPPETNLKTEDRRFNPVKRHAIRINYWISSEKKMLMAWLSFKNERLLFGTEHELKIKTPFQALARKGVLNKKKN